MKGNVASRICFGATYSRLSNDYASPDNSMVNGFVCSLGIAIKKRRLSPTCEYTVCGSPMVLPVMASLAVSVIVWFSPVVIRLRRALRGPSPILDQPSHCRPAFFVSPPTVGSNSTAQFSGQSRPASPDKRLPRVRSENTRMVRLASVPVFSASCSSSSSAASIPASRKVHPQPGARLSSRPRISGNRSAVGVLSQSSFDTM